MSSQSITSSNNHMSDQHSLELTILALLIPPQETQNTSKQQAKLFPIRGCNNMIF